MARRHLHTYIHTYMQVISGNTMARRHLRAGELAASLAAVIISSHQEVRFLFLCYVYQMFVCVCLHMCIHIHIHTCCILSCCDRIQPSGGQMLIYIHVCVCVCGNIYQCLCLCVCARMRHTYIYVYIHTYIHTYILAASLASVIVSSHQEVRC